MFNKEYTRDSLRVDIDSAVSKYGGSRKDVFDVLADKLGQVLSADCNENDLCGNCVDGRLNKIIAQIKEWVKEG